MYNSALSGRTSAPNQPAIRARKTRPHAHPDTTVRLWDEEEEEFYERDFQGGVGPQITQEILILPDEIETARSRGWEVSKDDAALAERLCAKISTPSVPLERAAVVAEFGIWPNPLRHIGGEVRGYRVTVNGRVASAIYPDVPERFRDKVKFDLKVK